MIRPFQNSMQRLFVVILLLSLFSILSFPAAAVADDLNDHDLHIIKIVLGIGDLGDTVLRKVLDKDVLPSTPVIQIMKGCLSVYTIGNCIYEGDYQCSLNASATLLATEVFAELGVPGIGTMVAAVQAGIALAEEFIAGINDAVIKGKIREYIFYRQQGWSDLDTWDLMSCEFTWPNIPGFTIQQTGEYVHQLCLQAWEISIDNSTARLEMYKVGDTIRSLVSPKAAFLATPSSGRVPIVVNLDAGASTSSEQGSAVTNYHWAIQDTDGTHSFDETSPFLDYQFNQPGYFAVSLTVKDDTGIWSSAAQTTINVTSPVHAKFSFSPSHPDVGENVTFDASDSYDEEGDITNYYWTFGDGSGANGPIVTKAFDNDGIYQVTLKVDGSSGYSDTNLKVSVQGVP